MKYWQERVLLAQVDSLPFSRQRQGCSFSRSAIQRPQTTAPTKVKNPIFQHSQSYHTIDFCICHVISHVVSHRVIVGWLYLSRGNTIIEEQIVGGVR